MGLELKIKPRENNCEDTHNIKNYETKRFLTEDFIFQGKRPKTIHYIESEA